MCIGQFLAVHLSDGWPRLIQAINCSDWWLRVALHVAPDPLRYVECASRSTHWTLKTLFELWAMLPHLVPKNFSEFWVPWSTNAVLYLELFSRVVYEDWCYKSCSVLPICTNIVQIRYSIFLILFRLKLQSVQANTEWCRSNFEFIFFLRTNTNLLFIYFN